MTFSMVKQCRKLKAKLAGSSRDLIFSDQTREKEAAKRSKQLDKRIKGDWKKEQRYIKLLLLGPGEAGKSTLIKQMQIIHGDDLDLKEKMNRIPYIRQNIFDSLVAILVAMKEFNIPLANPELEEGAQYILSHSQVHNPKLTSRDILHSPFLQSNEFFDHAAQLWDDEGVRCAYSRSNEYQLLDCAAYFFDKIETIRQPDYIPSEQDCLRCRVMTTSITETTFCAPHQGQNVNFKVLDVGGQQGERRKWITLFDGVTAVLYVTDVSSFDQTLREDSHSNRLLESLKVFYQVITTKYLRSVSILTFMNKIDILKEKIERGADFAAALERIKQEALFNSSVHSANSDYDRHIYTKLYDILCENPYTSFRPTEQDRKSFCEAFPAPESDLNHNSKKPSRLLAKKTSNSSLFADINEEVVKAASYMKMLLKAIIDKVEDRHHSLLHDPEFRSYIFHYTCAVDKNNIKKVIDGCKKIIVKDYLNKMGITLS